MTKTLPQSVPAAQYLRMSTERQEYSTENQSQVIAKYAASHGFYIIQTYSDPALTGVVFRRRKGLQNLIQDVVEHRASYKAILVYDVSRWGRFLDVDESAYYEFLCKSAGIRVHYCAELFVNDDSLASSIMKSLKRAMAGEYSRELGVKVFDGQVRGATLGFRQGAQPGFGLRRLLVSADRTPKQVLVEGERKSITTDRIILVPGPPEEVRLVREIYRMFIQKHMTFSAIARELNRRNVAYIQGSQWNLMAVQKILTHPKYIGCNVYGRFAQRLYTKPVLKPRSEWVVIPGAFAALVKPEIYAKAQRIIARTAKALPRNRSDQELLDDLREILRKNGRITTDLINESSKTPSAQTYNTRFGRLSCAYKLAGYGGFWCDGWLEMRRQIQKLRNELLKAIVDHDPTRVFLEKQGSRYRSRLRIEGGTLVSVIASRPFRGYKGDVRWLLFPRADESRLITLVARLNLECSGFKDMFIIPPVGEAVAVYLKDYDPRLENAARLTDVAAFRDKIDSLLSVYSRFPRHLPRPKKYRRESAEVTPEPHARA
jgi:DNA invertase Pin-like site-specific DNA recombinase